MADSGTRSPFDVFHGELGEIRARERVHAVADDGQVVSLTPRQDDVAIGGKPIPRKSPHSVGRATPRRGPATASVCTAARPHADCRGRAGHAKGDEGIIFTSNPRNVVLVVVQVFIGLMGGIRSAQRDAATYRHPPGPHTGAVGQVPIEPLRTGKPNRLMPAECSAGKGERTAAISGDVRHDGFVNVGPPPKRRASLTFARF